MTCSSIDLLIFVSLFVLFLFHLAIFGRVSKAVAMSYPIHISMVYVPLLLMVDNILLY